MSEENKRIFVGGISANITERDLVSKFKKFGGVKSVELKTKKDALGGPPNTFAFIDISLTPDSLYECFTTLGNSKWKGSCLRLEVAKENFLDRLKKEREHQQTSSNKETELQRDSCNAESRQIARKWEHGKLKRASDSLGLMFSIESPKKIPKTIANRRATEEDATSGNLPPFKGFSFSGKGEFDFLFETSERSLNVCIPSRNKRKKTREVDAPEKSADDLMNRMESFSSMWKDDNDSVKHSPEMNETEDDVVQETEQAPFQASVSSYIRFDPTRKDHQKYILSPNKKEKKKSKKAAVNETDDTVTKDKFYKVVDDLKNRFDGKNNAEGSFSLLAALGNQTESKDVNDYNEDAGEQFEESWDSWDKQEETVNKDYRSTHYINKFFIVAGDPRLEEGVAFISEKPERKEMLKKWKEQKPMLKLLWKKKHKDALREDKGVKVLRGTSLAFPGRGRGQKAFRKGNAY